MQVARLHGARDMRLHDEPRPTPNIAEALVRVTAVGICGSDLHWFADAGIGDARLERPLVLGHEFAGIVEGTGQRVAIDPLVACGVCEPCRDGNPNLCLAQKFAGHGAHDGALREYIAWTQTSLFALPDSLSDSAGAMLEPLGVALHAVNLAHLQPGMTVSVCGCGTIGLLMIQVARVGGAVRILATDKLPHRLDAARAFGAETFFADGDEAAAMLAATHQRGVDVAFEAGDGATALTTALTTVKHGGAVVWAGIPDNDAVSLSASMARRKGLTIKAVRRMKHTYPRAIELAARRIVDVESLITHRFPLAQIEQAFRAAARRDGIKVMVTVS